MNKDESRTSVDREIDQILAKLTPIEYDRILTCTKLLCDRADFGNAGEEGARSQEIEAKIQEMRADLQQGSSSEWLYDRVCQELRTGEIMTQTVKRIWEHRYERVPVSLKEFITSGSYLNLRIAPDDVDAKILAALEVLFGHRITDVILAGANLTAKSTFGALALLYEIYLLSCMRDPAKTYGLMRGSNITFLVLVSRQRNIECDLVSVLSHLVSSSKYFTKIFPCKYSARSGLTCRHNIHLYSAASRQQSVLGVGVFSAFLEGFDLFPAGEGPPVGGARTRRRIKKREQLLQAVRMRMTSRFNLAGKLPGHIYLSCLSPYPKEELASLRDSWPRPVHVFDDAALGIDDTAAESDDSALKIE